MRTGIVHDEAACLNRLYTAEQKGSNTLAVFKPKTIIWGFRVIVEDAFDAGAKLELKVDGNIEYGAAIDLTSVGVTEIAGKGMLKDMQQIEANITGEPTTGGVRVLVNFFFPSQVEKGI